MAKPPSADAGVRRRRRRTVVQNPRELVHLNEKGRLSIGKVIVRANLSRGDQSGSGCWRGVFCFTSTVCRVVWLWTLYPGENLVDNA